MLQPTIFITGGAGFIGSALVHYLIQHTDYSIVNIDKLTYAGHLSSLETILNHPRHTFIQADINDSCLLDKLFKQHQPCGIIHLAAESHVDNAILSPSAFIETNIMGTFSLLQASLNYWQRLPEKKQSTFRFHHVSTDEVYGNLAENDTPFRENSPYRPQNPYAASKASSDHLVNSWHNTYAIPIIITHSSNNYGPHQLPEKLIPKLIINAIQGQSLTIYGDGRQIRDWLYVDDHAAAIWHVFQHGEIGETYNIGDQNELRNIELTYKICDLLDKYLPCHYNANTSEINSYRELIINIQDRPGHDTRYSLDTNKIQHKLGWSAKTRFQDGLIKTINWYLSHAAWWQALKPHR